MNEIREYGPDGIWDEIQCPDCNWITLIVNAEPVNVCEACNRVLRCNELCKECKHRVQCLQTPKEIRK